MTPEQIQSLREKFFKECEFFTRRQIFEWFIKELQERNSDVASEIVLENLDNGNAETYVPSGNNSNQASVASNSCTVGNSIQQRLTPEILLQLGFKQGDDKLINKYYYYTKHIAINPENGYCFISDNCPHMTARECPLQRKILYLHELNDVAKCMTGESLLNSEQNVHGSVATTAPTELPNPDKQ